MRRQINLVNPALLPPKPFFQFRSMVLALAVLACGLFLLSAFLLSQLKSYETAAADALHRVEAKQAQIKAQEQTLVQRQRDPLIAADLDALRADELELQRIDQALQTGNAPTKSAERGASAYLYALARQPLPGVWLNSIQVHGDSVSLQGMAMSAAAIPETLALLNKLPAFQAQNFAAFEVERQALSGADLATSTEVLSFRLDSAASKAKESGK
jgi:Tfp pilus assembly protein PilN